MDIETMNNLAPVLVVAAQLLCLAVIGLAIGQMINNHKRKTNPKHNRRISDGSILFRRKHL